MLGGPFLLTENRSPNLRQNARVAVMSDDVRLRHSLMDGMSEFEAWFVTLPARATIPVPTPDLVVVDLRNDAEAVVASIRTVSDVPIVGIVEAGRPDLASSALDCGADDTIDWPGSPDLLRARMRALLSRSARRSAQKGPESLLTGPEGVELYPRAHEATVRGQPVNFTPREFEVLRVLLEHRGEVLSTDQISARLWGHPTFGSRNFVEAHVSRIRTKLRAAGATEVITTIRGVGYKVRL